MIMSTVKKLGTVQRIKIQFSMCFVSPCLFGIVELIAATIAHVKKNVAL